MYSEKRKKMVWREKNKIYVRRLDHPARCSAFVRAVNFAFTQDGYNQFTVCFNIEPHSYIFPNACVPILTAIENFKNCYGIQFNYEYIGNSKHLLDLVHFDEPIYLSDSEIEKLESPFNFVMRYEKYDQVFAFTQKCLDFIRHNTICETGTIEGLSWCINEVMDNVSVHSESDCGYVMAQFQKQTNRIALCVSDYGIGIFNTLKDTPHHPSAPMDALSLAVQEGVGDGKGQGNGLFGLYSIIRSNGGTLTLTSSGASLMFTMDGMENKYDNIPVVSNDRPGTIVDFQLHLDKKVDLHKALSTIGGYNTVDFEIEEMIDDNDVIQYDVYDHCKGTATREAGYLLRNDVINTIRQAEKVICLDFSKVATVSSSFIDEFISKMVLDLGFLSFHQIVRIKNMNNTIKFLCERSTYMRIYENWSNNQREKEMANE